MFGKVFQMFVTIIYVCVVAFDDLVHGQGSQEMMENGKGQYQLLRERANLPQYGNCWKAAINHVDEGCRMLSEETQSDMALFLTNCFLEMSGLDTYSCHSDKKPNVRAICIRSMSNRAFNVYTAFYTHTQNMCWFLRSQVWHETITENTRRVGKQLEMSAAKQQDIIDGQRESLRIQEVLLNHGQRLQKVLSDSVYNAEKVFEEYRATSKQHYQVMSMVATSLGGLQSWLLGEVSWLDSVVFYVGSAIIAALITSSKRTSSARFPVLLMLSVNVALERMLCNKLIADSIEQDISISHVNLHQYVWWCRNLFVALCIIILLIQICRYKNYDVFNNELLLKIHQQNQTICDSLHNNKNKTGVVSNDRLTFTREISESNRSSVDNDFTTKYNYYNNLNSSKENGFLNTNRRSVSVERDYDVNSSADYTLNRQETPKESNVSFYKNENITTKKRLLPLFEVPNNLRYNLRSSSRTGTPDIL